jgi:hypothetical protein
MSEAMKAGLHADHRTA